MNKRILSPQLLKLVQAAGPGYSQANPEWVKKFAELIVRERTLTEFAKLVEEKATEKANARSNASWALMCKKMVENEREACAMVCESYIAQSIGKEMAQAIRARDK